MSILRTPLALDTTNFRRAEKLSDTLTSATNLVKLMTAPSQENVNLHLKPNDAMNEVRHTTAQADNFFDELSAKFTESKDRLGEQIEDASDKSGRTSLARTGLNLIEELRQFVASRIFDKGALERTIERLRQDHADLTLFRDKALKFLAPIGV